MEDRATRGHAAAEEHTRDRHKPAGRMTSRRAAGELEAEVLASLWAAEEPLTTADVRQAVGGALAYNTVQTILVRLYDKGLIDRLADGRRHEYFPVKGAEELAAEQMQALLSRGRDRQAVLQRFATSLSVEDARLLRAMLRRRR
ncbi:MAG: BlaI/MecI/CopY family transcriptional regulator [Pseudonocardiaceae bacterium]